MEKDKVPQHDAGLPGGVREIQYAVDENGRSVDHEEHAFCSLTKLIR